MATISSPPLSNPLIVDAVDVDTVLTATATEYEWTSSDGVHIWLEGSFVYSAGTTLDAGASTVTDVAVDVDFNGSVDLLVDFGLPNSVVGALTSGSTLNFRNALFEGQDSGVLDGTFGPAALAGMALDALLPSGSSYLGDTFQLRGSGYVVGDTGTGGTGNAGGADVLTVSRTNDTSISIIHGDFTLAAGSFFGGDDLIEDIGATSTGTTTFIGDLFQLSLVFPSTITGGVDTLIGENANAHLIGDIERILEPGHTILGGDDSIEGGSGNDTLTGDVDTLFSGADNNIITGGDDTLQGRDGDDYIAGDVRVIGVTPAGNTITGGDDLLEGGAGADSLFGDFPSELLYALGNTVNGGDDTLNGDGGDDFLHGGSGDDTLNGGADNDRLIGGLGNDRIVGSTGIDTLDYSESAGAITLTLNSLGNGLASGDGTDSVFGIENMIGSDFADTLGGGSLDNLIVGGEGDDSLSGGGGQDTLSYADSSANLAVDLSNQGVGQSMGSLGTDIFVNFEVVWTGSGNDTVTADMLTAAGGGALDFDGGAGVDRFVMAANGAVSTIALGVDVLNFENVTGSVENDSIVGDTGSNNLQGRAGNDTVEGGGGGDTISGGNGDDEVTLGLGGGTARGEGGNDVVTGSSDMASDLSGGIGNDTMDGGSGNDTIRGQGNDDSILGGGGDDDLFGGSGDDYVNGGSGADYILGQGNNDTLQGGADNDTLIGAAGADALIGDGGDDSLTGGNGADFLDGGSGNDTLSGGTQSDEFAFGLGFDADRINAYEQGVDVLLLDENLWDSTTPGLTEQQVIDTYGSLNTPGTILTLDFGGGDVLEIQRAVGITQSTLGLDVTIVDFGST